MRTSLSLIEGSVSRRLLSFTFPILYASILQSLNGSINSMWVGHYLGTAALAATSNANTAITLVVGVTLGIVSPTTALVGRYIGEGNVDRAKRVVGTGATFLSATAIVIAVAGLIFSKALLEVIGTPPAALPLALPYMRLVLLTVPSSVLYLLIMAVLRGSGDSTTPAHFMLLSTAIDLVLNPIFIFGVGPVPRLGVAGSGLAGFTAQVLSLAALVRHLYRHQYLLCLHKHELSLGRLDWDIVAAIVRKGVPMGAHWLVLFLGNLLMISLVNPFGVDVTAAFGASMQLWSYIQMPAMAVSMAVFTMVAQNAGAKKWDRVESIARLGVVYSTFLTAGAVVSIGYLDTQVLGLFAPPGSLAVSIASHINRIASSSFVFVGISTVLFGAVRSTGTVLKPLCIVAFVLVARFPLTAALIGRWHADAIWWSFPISSVITAGLATWEYRYGRWRELAIKGVPAKPVPAAPLPSESSHTAAPQQPVQKPAERASKRV